MHPIKVSFSDQGDKRNQEINAKREMDQYRKKLVVQPDQYGGNGLFARRRLEIEEIDLSYWGGFIKCMADSTVQYCRQVS